MPFSRYCGNLCRAVRLSQAHVGAGGGYGGKIVPWAQTSTHRSRL
jgi:hypothetical protein